MTAGTASVAEEARGYACAKMSGCNRFRCRGGAYAAALLRTEGARDCGPLISPVVRRRPGDPNNCAAVTAGPARGILLHLSRDGDGVRDFVDAAHLRTQRKQLFEFNR
jgi:hypothetical protein